MGTDLLLLFIYLNILITDYAVHDICHFDTFLFRLRACYTDFGGGGMQAGRMAVAQLGACLANGAAEEMKMERHRSWTSCQLIRGADGDVCAGGAVRGPSLRACGRAPHTLCAQWVHRAPKGAKPEICRRTSQVEYRQAKRHRAVRKSTAATTAKVTLQTHQITEDRGPRTEDRAPAPAEPPTRDSNSRLHDPKSSVLPVRL